MLTSKSSPRNYHRTLHIRGNSIRGSRCGLIGSMSWGKREKVYLSANRVTAESKLYGLCHLRPPLPATDSGRRRRLRHICYQPQRLIITSPQSTGALTCAKAGGRHVWPDRKDKIEQGHHAGGWCWRFKSSLKPGEVCGHGRWAEGEGLPGTYHNDVFMLLGSQVCVLKDERREQEENKAKHTINKMEIGRLGLTHTHYYI